MESSWNPYNKTDPKEIVRLSKEIFGETVCGTCRGQLITAHQKLSKHFREQEETMGKLKELPKAEAEQPKAKYKLKPEFEGATHADGTNSILLSDVELSQVETIFTPDQIKEYFERN